MPSERDEASGEKDEVGERIAHEPEAAMAAHVLDPGHRPPVTYPDDSPLVRTLRKVDRAIGVGEQAVLFGLLNLMVVVACVEAIAERLHSGFLWSFEVVRDSTFAIAMLGAAFATHQMRNLSMDLVSRRLPARGRLVLRIVLALFTVAVAALLVRSGLHQLGTVGEEGGDHLISTHTIVTFMPVGAVLIIVHTLLHMVIDLDYLVRGKIPPERMRSGH